MEKKASALYAAAMPLVGALITIMSGVNSALSVRIGTIGATLVIHLVGLAASSVLLLVAREETRTGRAPLRWYLGGFVGVGTVFASNYSFAELGASLAVALALVGQAGFSIVLDATGLLGRTRYPFSARRLPGIILAIAGVAVMTRIDPAGGALRHVPAVLCALLLGVLPVVSFSLGSELGRRKGVIHSTRANYLVGLLTTLAIGAAWAAMGKGSVDARGVVSAVRDAGPLLALGGGIMGVGVIAATNLIFPRLSAFSFTLLLFSGQALAGIVVDVAAGRGMDLAKIAGTLILLAGLATNAWLSRAVSAEAARGRVAAVQDMR